MVRKKKTAKNRAERAYDYEYGIVQKTTIFAVVGTNFHLGCVAPYILPANETKREIEHITLSVTHTINLHRLYCTLEARAKNHNDGKYTYDRVF